MRVLSNGKVRRSETEWATIVKDFELSGQSLGIFCKERRVAASSMSKWRRRFGSGGGEEFVEVEPQALAASGAERARVELEFGGGLILRVWG